MINPFSHQVLAVSSIINELIDKNKTNCLMACGTGKTKVCIWAAEKLKSKNIVVFVPTLTLISQYIQEWETTYHDSAYIYFVVCSDKTVTRLKPWFKCSTDVEKINNFIKIPSIVTKVVFCTYTSSKVLSSALPENYCFDFGIFDEAHRTAGFGKNRRFSMCLNDNLMPIKKKLFVTATPIYKKVYKNNKKLSKNDVFSMCNKNIYGNTSFILSLEEAIQKKLVTDFKIIVGTYLAKNELDNEVFDKLVALREAINKVGSKKIITYHKSIIEAKKSIEVIKTNNILHDFDFFHINGSMSMEERKIIFQEFERSPKSVLTNSRCLTEGVDIPKVDMVAFMDSKTSQVDIIQAVGRCIRLSKGKKIGYIFVPFFINNSEKEEEEQFRQLVDVLRSIKFVTHSFSEINLGSSSDDGAPKRIFKDFIEVLNLEDKINFDYTNKIEAVLIEHFPDNWNILCLELRSLIKKHGPIHFQKFSKNPKMREWIKTQRKTYLNNKILPERKNKLKEIGFIFDFKDELFNYGFELLRSYKEEMKTLIISRKHKDRAYLASFCVDKRKDYREGKLQQWKIDALNSLGFDWKS